MSTIDATTDQHPPSRLAAGGRIEVWNQFLGTFAGEFEIADVTDAGYRIRRPGESGVLPADFPHEDVRPLT